MSSVKAPSSRTMPNPDLLFGAPAKFPKPPRESAPVPGQVWRTENLPPPGSVQRSVQPKAVDLKDPSTFAGKPTDDFIG